MTSNHSFGQSLKNERKKLGLTVQQLSDKCGVSRSYLTLIENDQRLPGKKHIPIIATALELKTAVVLNWYLEDISHKIKLSVGE